MNPELRKKLQALLDKGSLPTEKELNDIMNAQNNRAIANFDGISPQEMHNLMYEGISENTIVRWQSPLSDEQLNQIPMFCLLEAFLDIIQKNEFLKLTPKGAIQKKILIELYEKGILKERFIEQGISKLNRQEDCMTIDVMCVVASISGLTRKANGKLYVTKKASNWMAKNQRFELFKDFFINWSIKFNWGFRDGYPHASGMQKSFSYLIWLLLKYGDEKRVSTFYGDKFLVAFPFLIAEFQESRYDSAEVYFSRALTLRFFNRFLGWFNFVKVNDESSSIIDVQTTPLFKEVFYATNLKS